MTEKEVLTPPETLQAAIAAGRAKVSLHKSPGRMVVLTLLAGAYIALGGILSVISGFGFPEATAANPALQKLISGTTFPVGLILVVVLGAELFTGNNALLVPAAARRHYAWGWVWTNWLIVWLGNFAGALAFTWLMVHLTGLLAPEPWHSAIIGIAEAKVSMPWLTVFLKAIGANWCVCAAVWLAMSSRSMIGKMLGCWFPVMAFVVLGYEHCIANMFFIPAGMLEGANVTIGQMITANLIPATLGNIIGGAILVGGVHYYLHHPRQITE